MKALVTGATGKVGHATARSLIAAGWDVRALVRDRSRAAGVVPDGVELVVGDVVDAGTLDAAAAGCEVVFAAHGLPEQWLADEQEFVRVNVDGVANVVRAAARAGARRVVHTSTIDVFAKDSDGVLRETQLDPSLKGTPYERSKQRAETAALKTAGSDVELVFANPAAVYGPGPLGSASLEKALFSPVVRGSRAELPVLTPGGMGVVFSDGVGEGHRLVAEKGAPGERYILCDTHVTLRELAETVARVAGRGRVPGVLPVPLARAFAAAGEGVARVVRRPPLLPRGQLTFLLWNAAPDSSKAQAELGWQPTPLDTGVARALEALGLVL